MKNTVIKTSILLLMVGALSSCQKKLETLYNNPEKVGTGNIGTFFTAMLNSDRVRPAYWNVRTFLLPHTAVYTQTASFTNSNTVYQQNDGYTGNYWSDFYYPAGNGSGPMALYRQMQTTYSSLSTADQASQEIFMQAAKIFLCDQASQMVDLWGDIPYSGAGNLETSSTIKDAKFDDAKTLYTTFISDLDNAATFFSKATTSTAFTKQDILLGGKTDQWRRYANSLRLRLLMRISFVDEATAKTAVTNMLSNSSSYPLIDGGGSGNYNPATTDVLLQALTTNTNNLNSALTEIGSFYAPDYMVNTVMIPANDPRLPVMFDKYGTTVNKVFIPNKTFRAMPITYTTAQTDTAYTKYSIVDSLTFLQNSRLPGIVLTSAEVNFLKAEAYERWGGGSAQTAYETAVTQSVYFYYYLNTLGGGNSTPTGISTFLTAPNVAYTGSSAEKLGKIWTQKWLNFDFLQSKQAWAEYRRTKYPLLTFPTTGKLAGYTTPPNRLVYPSVETGYNSNYSSVQGKDSRTNKIFWDVK